MLAYARFHAISDILMVVSIHKYAYNHRSGDFCVDGGQQRRQNRLLYPSAHAHGVK